MKSLREGAVEAPKLGVQRAFSVPPSSSAATVLPGIYRTVLYRAILYNTLLNRDVLHYTAESCSDNSTMILPCSYPDILT